MAPTKRLMIRRATARAVTSATAAALATFMVAGCRPERAAVANPRPVRLTRPAAAPLSAMAQLGRAIFYDSSLSASGRRSCASCHRPDHAYASAERASVILAGASGATGVRNESGARGIVRAIPSLRYAYRAPNFSVGPELDDDDDLLVTSPGSGAAPSPPPLPTPLAPGERPTKNAGGASRADILVARGGLFWDGRVNTLQDQAMGPLFNANEMGNISVASVAAALRRAPYARQFVTLFGVRIFAEPALFVDEAMFAVARYQIEDPSFHPYTSKYDYYLEGKATLTRAEWRGLQAFDDEKRGNCAACHLDAPRGDGLPPAFTDFEYVALGVPHDSTAPSASSPGTDLGACGPLRGDLAGQTTYCGAFRTPSLRNTAIRAEFFHNGVYRTLEQVLAFYNLRDVQPERVYPTAPGGSIAKFNDLPARLHGNVDTTDPPFNRKRGAAPPMTERDMADIIAFLRTLTDGFVPGSR